MRGWNVAVAFLVVAGCGGGASPEKVAQGFWDAVTASDTEGVKTYIRKADYKMVQEKKGKDSGLAEGTIELGAAEIDGDNATVPATLSMKGKTYEIDTMLVREDGVWKVNLDSTMDSMMQAMMGTTMEALQKGMQEGMKKMGEAMMEGMKEGMKNMGEEMKKGVKEPGTKKPD